MHGNRETCEVNAKYCRLGLRLESATYSSVDGATEGEELLRLVSESSLPLAVVSRSYLVPWVKRCSFGACRGAAEYTALLKLLILMRTRVGLSP